MDEIAPEYDVVVLGTGMLLLLLLLPRHSPRTDSFLQASPSVFCLGRYSELAGLLSCTHSPGLQCSECEGK
jgi:hypothetical protein